MNLHHPDWSEVSSDVVLTGVSGGSMDKNPATFTVVGKKGP